MGNRREFYEPERGNPRRQKKTKGGRNRVRCMEHKLRAKIWKKMHERMNGRIKKETPYEGSMKVRGYIVRKKWRRRKR